MYGELSYTPHPLDERRLDLGPWQAFERSLARFLQHGGYKDVKVVGGTGDGGADIVASLNGKRCLVQAKYRSSGSVGKDAVKEAYDAMWLYEAETAIAATNIRFSKEAKSFCQDKINAGFDIKLWDRDFLLQYSKELNEESAAKINLRNYQNEAVETVLNSYLNNNKKSFITLATGLGKTVIASTILSEIIKIKPDAKILVLAHMNDLVKQLEQSSWPQLMSTTHTHLWADGEKPAFEDGVTFATWQSLNSAVENGLYLKNMFDVIIVDEAHHAASPSFVKLINELNASFLFGLTATPWRGDGFSLRPIFGDPVFSMDIVEGMQKGFLADVDYKMFVDGIDWEDISSLSKQGLTVKDLNTKLLMPERDLGIIETIQSTIKEIKEPRVLVFCRSIVHAERLKNYFAQYDIPAGILHSDISRSDRFLTLTNFRNGNLSVLISIEMLNEGIDVPEVNMVVFARVTHSRRIFLQQLGRGLRLTENKKSVIVLDFVADVRRIAAAVEMNKEAKKYIGETEIIRYPDGEIVNFSSQSGSFFHEYLADMANISDLDEDSKLQFPPV